MTQHLLPKGFLFSGIHAGLKDLNELDLALIYSEKVCQTVALFTQNHFPGEPVKLAKERLELGLCQAIAINSKISNVATGEAGLNDTKEICDIISKELNISENLCLVSSTGIIGRRYPENVIQKAIPRSVSSLESSSHALDLASKAIMTTDTIPKVFSTKSGEATITMIAKGSGMIAPNMATMLVFIMSDAEISSEKLQPMLNRVVNSSFNNLSIDFDTSTSDSCFLMCNGEAGLVNEEDFEQRLKDLAWLCSEALVLDGEGVDTIIDCKVTEASDDNLAREVADSIINSPLVKTMITGADPNWGRLIMAIGKVRNSLLAGVKPDIHINEILVFKEGAPYPHDLNLISESMKNTSRVTIEIKLNLGQSETRFLGANLTKDYVSINADYTT